MKKKSLLWIASASALILAVGLFVTVTGSIRPAAQTMDGGKEAAPADSAATDKPAAEATATADGGLINIEAALADRALGDPKAPVRMDEYASLTCSHCADFSKKTFDQIREAYVDTGKVYFVYHDFPLNAPALDAAVIARCLPQERYFPFVKFLFESQDKWVASDYKTNLRQNAKLVGMNDDHFAACLGSEKLKTSLVEKMQQAEKKYDINATPTFVFNDGAEKMSGSMPFESFQKTIDGLLKEKAGAE